VGSRGTRRGQIDLSEVLMSIWLGGRLRWADPKAGTYRDAGVRSGARPLEKRKERIHELSNGIR